MVDEVAAPDAAGAAGSPSVSSTAESLAAVETPASAAPAQAAAPASPWDAISDANVKSWVAAKGFPDVDRLATSAFHLEKLTGDLDSVMRLPKEQTPENMRPIWERLGAGKATEDYKFPVPEGGDDSFAKEGAKIGSTLRIRLPDRALVTELFYGVLRGLSALDFLIARLRDREHEVFCCLFLDSRHRLISFEELFRGTVDGASVHPREVVKQALARNATAVILAHNHPSGIAEPSQADEIITTRLRDALALVDIRVLDHLIVGDGTCASLAERGIV